MTEKGPPILGMRTRLLDQTAMGFCTLYRRVQIHTGKRFRTSAQLEGTKHQISSIQHYGKTQLPRWWNNDLGRDLTRWSR
ncbi:uncharacterized protein TNCV_1862961 [Trichonephila clavipes]|nr:uncharacterized protein TNCV_1862961 [Trichonephila clavipes]